MEQICIRAIGIGTAFSTPINGRSVISEVTGSEVRDRCGIGKKFLLRNGTRKLKINIGDIAFRIRFGYNLRLDLGFKWLSPETRLLEATIN